MIDTNAIRAAADCELFDEYSAILELCDEVDAVREKNAGLERVLKSHRLSHNDWFEKTAWVQGREFPFPCVGKHIADVMAEYIKILEDENKRLRE